MMDQEDIRRLFPNTFTIDEGARQLIILGLALTAIQRPGFHHACREAAETLHGSIMFDEFKRLNTRPSGLGVAGAQLQAPYT
jgi:hypothetical protein